MEQTHTEPQPPTIPVLSKAEGRHDGWTGDKMATFCESLAESAVVAEACDAAGMGISGAYAARRRMPVFAAAWDAALSIARERLADTLLARSMEGNIEQIYKDGELIGERHLLDNRLGLAILRRLDRLAETGIAASTRGERFPVAVRAERWGGAPALHCHPQPIDWNLAVDALRTGDEEGVAHALALVKGHEVEEVEDPPVSLSQGDSDDDSIDLSDRCWKSDELGEPVWMTDFAPPAGFDGYENGKFGSFAYERECTTEEAAVLEAGAAAERAIELAEDAELRDAWFAMLREDLDGHPGLDPAPAFPSTAVE
jgi:hypothetical protein